jgi:hypothetical protein
MEKRVKAQIVLAIVLTSGFIIITILAFVKLTEEQFLQVFTPTVAAIAGAWIVNFTTMINYWFGSSQGSKDKTDMQNEITKKIVEKS